MLKRIKDIEQLEEDIVELESILASKNKMKKIIIKELEEVTKKYDGGRKSEILYEVDDTVEEETVEVADYPVTLFIGEQKIKEGDSLLPEIECSNKDELLFFTNQCQVYKAKVDDFADTKASVLGEYVPGKLEMAEGEQVVYTAVVSEYTGYMIFVFENGKLAKVDMASYATKTNRKKLINAYSNKAPLVQAMYIKEDLTNAEDRCSGRE